MTSKFIYTYIYKFTSHLFNFYLILYIYTFIKNNLLKIYLLQKNSIFQYKL